ncbi:hypothetical protein XENTR_v10004925 [Xenopus tropicalis]|nr:hypothetical protein XENTR_v10004925 [Xenopus tropicalis]
MFCIMHVYMCICMCKYVGVSVWVHLCAWCVHDVCVAMIQGVIPIAIWSQKGIFPSVQIGRALRVFAFLWIIACLGLCASHEPSCCSRHHFGSSHRAGLARRYWFTPRAGLEPYLHTKGQGEE